jgi:hypothetical protein
MQSYRSVTPIPGDTAPMQWSHLPRDHLHSMRGAIDLVRAQKEITKENGCSYVYPQYSFNILFMVHQTIPDHGPICACEPFTSCGNYYL